MMNTIAAIAQCKNSNSIKGLLFCVKNPKIFDRRNLFSVMCDSGFSSVLIGMRQPVRKLNSHFSQKNIFILRRL